MAFSKPTKKTSILCTPRYDKRYTKKLRTQAHLVILTQEDLLKNHWKICTYWLKMIWNLWKKVCHQLQRKLIAANLGKRWLSNIIMKFWSTIEIWVVRTWFDSLSICILMQRNCISNTLKTKTNDISVIFSLHKYFIYNAKKSLCIDLIIFISFEL